MINYGRYMKRIKLDNKGNYPYYYRQFPFRVNIPGFV